MKDYMLTIRAHLSNPVKALDLKLRKSCSTKKASKRAFADLKDAFTNRVSAIYTCPVDAAKSGGYALKSIRDWTFIFSRDREYTLKRAMQTSLKALKYLTASVASPFVGLIKPEWVVSFHKKLGLYAVTQNHPAAGNCLVEQDAKVDQADSVGWTLLIKAVFFDEGDRVKSLIDQGANVNKADSEGVSPLMLAAKFGRFNLVKYLVDHGADVYKADNKGRTPLMSAVESGDIDVVKCLVDHGADVNKADNKGRTPLMSAVDSAELDVVKYLVDHGTDVNKADNKGRTLLMLTAESGGIDVVKYLVDHGADINKADNKGRTALVYAETWDYEEIMDFLDTIAR